MRVCRCTSSRQQSCTAFNNSPLAQKVHHLLDVALLIIDGLVLLKYKRYALWCTTSAGLSACACMLW